MRIKNVLALITLGLGLLVCRDSLAFYNPSTGRWLSRDPVGEKGGKGVFAFDGNDAINRVDVFGLFLLDRHAELTHRSFDAAMEITGVEISPECRDRIVNTIKWANIGQDIFGFFALRRHYNRSLSADTEREKGVANSLYEKYLLDEQYDFAMTLVNPTRVNCLNALRTLGRMTHSWQDFYAHAIRRDGLGGKESGSLSPAEGWLAWTRGERGSPGDRGKFWPSSYSLFGGGEHPPHDEPLVENGAEDIARSKAASEYVRDQYINYIPLWLKRCSCSCP